MGSLRIGGRGGVVCTWMAGSRVMGACGTALAVVSRRVVVVVVVELWGDLTCRTCFAGTRTTGIQE